jgi:hypothetical protein
LADTCEDAAANLKGRREESVTLLGEAYERNALINASAAVARVRAKLRALGVRSGATVGAVGKGSGWEA